MNIAKTMSEVMEVGEGASVVKGPIRGICAAIFRLMTLGVLIVWAGKLYSGSNVDYKYRWLEIFVHLASFAKV